jgi:hypothetical protein
VTAGAPNPDIRRNRFIGVDESEIERRLAAGKECAKQHSSNADADFRPGTEASLDSEKL